MKNRFCRNTKLSEHEFHLVLLLYIRGGTAGETQEDLLELYGVKISRQTIATLFVRLGEYIWRRMFRDKMIAHWKSTNPDVERSDTEWEQVIHDQLWDHMLGNLDYAEFRKRDEAYPGDEVKLVDILRIRWRGQSGFPRHTFTSQLGIACLQALPIPRTPEGLLQMQTYVLEQLVEEPL
jgi:hypothetical protein